MAEITPPPELVKQWQASLDCPDNSCAKAKYIATQAARWGADQELEACCEWLHEWTQDKHPGGIENLRAARRPKPPSLKELALAVVENSVICDHLSPEHEAVLRRALEQLPDTL